LNHEEHEEEQKRLNDGEHGEHGEKQGRRDSLLVIPAKAGIQLLGLFFGSKPEQDLDSGFRWK
jgi:hypothetical protein